MGKSYLVLWALFAVLSFSVSAQSTDIKRDGLFLGISTGVLAGEAEEIVYRDKNTDNKLSQLLWPFKPLVYAGVDLRYNWRIPASRLNVFADGILKFGFPGITGKMEDRDWVDARYADFLTHYSIHDNTTEDAVLIDVNAGVTFPVFEKYLLKAFIAYNHMYFSWAASGGSFLYPDKNSGGHGYMVTSDKVITYRQTWNIISPGILFYGAFNRYFDIELSFKTSPFIWFFAVDEHLARNLVITDDLHGGFFVEPSLLFSFKPNNNITLSFSFLYRNITGTRGDGEYEEQGKQPLITNNLNGAAYSVFDTGIVTRFNIF
ncbi:MAG: omptin family outer membrane protease [Spirochaetaceae bacterium]|jgi:outer membrane protease|nr:omptin family outer membrane protease [Spirochaetaceae bacterium]